MRQVILFIATGILAVLKSNEARIDVETAVANAMRAKGIRATGQFFCFSCFLSALVYFLNSPALSLRQ